ncbi:MAG: MHS family MFS transporter [Nitrosomonadales bacterium]|jgi:metabolite-proton symporter|nr:MHS family MFS transporter [Nitrosomonadales bacterium]MBT3917797.1 MHS family MFS transporter [Nitrosomonadales bacterium]MBT4182828.1 MHS family MFS transporter [Nitrosomonadales bacterium]MBT4571334.1 MHS family MFS transporter [Nitrosomonadales bacterium]MBT4760001.1 MHS family MFS transporter [Nitrosomonadales bacterium]
MKKNSPAKVLFASLAGTTIEFFDFYIYANAAVLIFPSLFFAASTSSTEMLQSLATFSVAFFARPLGSAFFGHFGDRVGRKTTLVAALLTMGVSTVAIGLLPTYQSIGIFAPILLVICRFGQGFGLGGEWGGAVLLAVENAPPEKKAWYGMFPQLGAPIGLMLSGGIFLYLSSTMTEVDFFDYGWRIPFLLSSVLILIGLYVRLTILETPEFLKNQKNKKTLAVPFFEVFKNYRTPMILGTFIALATFVLFYLMTVYIASWAITDLNINREDFLGDQIESVLFFAVFIPISAVLADRYGRKLILIVASLGIILFGLTLGSLLNISILFTLSVGMALMGFTYGPLGTILSELYPTNVRYTGASLSFNFAGIVGASFAPFIALWLSTNFGLHFVGYYLALAAIISLIATHLSSKAK